MNYLHDMFGLSGKTAIVTGAAGGIGFALAQGLTRAGAFVALCDINEETLHTAAQQLQAEGLQPGTHFTTQVLDMQDTGRFAQVVKDIATHGIDILVNCAGINKREGLYDVAEETYNRIMDINLKGVFFLSQAVAPYMKERGGSIINIGSHNTGPVLGGVSVYAATKAGVLALTRSMAVEWAKYNIRANCISPGHIATPLTTPTWEHPTRSQYLLQRIALGRPGTPQDVVGLCVFLAGGAAGYITGEEFRVDGGCVCGGQPWEYDTAF